jgi:four helix bundle protein
MNKEQGILNDEGEEFENKKEGMLNLNTSNCIIVDRKFDLNERLINFAVAVIDISESLPKTFAGNHIAGQLVRSGTSPALNYGEAQSAESRNDFIHKMKISAKELRETFNCLKIIQKKHWHPEDKLLPVLNENNQLISIFVKSIETAKKNNTAK